MNESTPTSAAGALPPPVAGRRRWATVLLAAVIFAAGLVSGVGLTIVVAVHRLQYAIHHPDEGPARITAVLRRRLGLSEEQAHQVEAIVARRQADLAAIRRRTQPEVMRELEQVRAEIGAVLTADQRARWLRLYEEYRERWMPPLPVSGREVAPGK